MDSSLPAFNFEDVIVEDTSFLDSSLLFKDGFLVSSLPAFNFEEVIFDDARFLDSSLLVEDEGRMVELLANPLCIIPSISSKEHNLQSILLYLDFDINISFGGNF